MTYGDTESVGDRIKRVRGSMGVGDFAAALNVNRKTVTRWEANEALPDGASLLALFNRFGANPAWVLTGLGEAPPLAPDEAALLDNYRHASPEGQKTIREVGSAFAQSCLQPKAVSDQGGNHVQQNFQAPVGQVAGRDIVNKKSGRKR
ncbi:MAG: helix-turn-helix domain-containing protein [Pseudomonadota bacterium]